MRYTRLGRSGLVISRIGLGMMGFGDVAWRQWMLDEAAAEPIVRRAAEAGVTLFDTGNRYSTGASEQITGRLLRRIFTHRDKYVIATKVGAVLGPGPYQRGLSRRHILSCIDESLRRLGVSHVDLYQVHRFDPATPVEETVAALHDLVRAGKVRYLGAGSMYAWQFAKLQHAARAAGGPGFIAMQDHYNLVYREEEREMIPLCADLGVGIIPWSPLARGLLTGSRRLLAVAADCGLPPATVALTWLLARPAVAAPIIGATDPTHVDQAVAALDVTLTPQHTQRLEAPYRPHPVRGHE